MGIYCGMLSINAEWYLVLPCDSPLISKKDVDILISKIKEAKNNLCIIPKHKNGFIEPLFALYKRESLIYLRKIILEKDNLSIRYFIKHLNPMYINSELFDKKAFYNINTIEDLR